MPATGLLLVPYNGSMRLGQGYNSFLQVPCVDNAVTFDESKVVVEHVNLGPTQAVSCPSKKTTYSSRFVEKISDVARTMDISEASAIKSGGIEVSGNSLPVDEAKFLSSDLNVVVSVMNETTRLVDQAFNPIEHIIVDNDRFLGIYGDSYISGFIGGGELHGIVSIKALNASQKKDIKKAIQGQLNGMGGAPELTLSQESGGSQLSSILSETETAISVSWSGNETKPDSEEWSLDTLFRAAAAFPARVASDPQPTWAILTKYDNNREFVRWADKNKITIPQYQGVQAYTSELLDTCMEYKTNIARLQAVLRNPKDYVMSSVPEAISTKAAALVDQRKQMQTQMGLIVKEIDILCNHPERIEEVEERSQIQSPEVWATRLPVLKTTSVTESGLAGEQATPESSKSPFLWGTAPKTSGAGNDSTPITEVALCTPAVEAAMRPNEREFVTTPKNKSEFRFYRFDMPCGSDSGNPFNNARELQTASGTWPKRIQINFVQYVAGKYPIVGRYKLYYNQLTLQHGKSDRLVQTLSMDLPKGEYITKLKLATESNVLGLIYLEIETNQGRVQSIGDAHGHHIIEMVPPTGFLGLKGFYGCYGDVMDRMGAIWG